MSDLTRWENTLLADGWTPGGIYTEGLKYDPARSASFTRDGFKIHIYRAPECSKRERISAWGPDKLDIDLFDTYDLAAMQAQLKTCEHCGNSSPTVLPAIFGATLARMCGDCRTTLKLRRWQTQRGCSAAQQIRGE